MSRQERHIPEVSPVEIERAERAGKILGEEAVTKPENQSRLRDPKTCRAWWMNE